MTAFLPLTSGLGIGSAAEIYAQHGDSTQTAVDDAISDYMIIKTGTYVRINKDDLVINSKSGNSDDMIITARNSGNDVITLQADNVKISGLGIRGTKDSYTGVYLSVCNNCFIENKKS